MLLRSSDAAAMESLDWPSKWRAHSYACQLEHVAEVAYAWLEGLLPQWTSFPADDIDPAEFRVPSHA